MGALPGQLLGSVRTREGLNHGAMLGGADCALCFAPVPECYSCTQRRPDARQGGSDFAGLHRLFQASLTPAAGARRSSWGDVAVTAGSAARDGGGGSPRELGPRSPGITSSVASKRPGWCFELRKRRQALGKSDRLVAEPRKHLGGPPREAAAHRRPPALARHASRPGPVLVVVVRPLPRRRAACRS